MKKRSVRARAPRARSIAVTRVMQANVGRETSIEAAVRRAVFADGLRYRRDVRPEPGLRCTADLVFRGARVCVFVDGCFWHGCRRHFVAPASNRGWWVEKIDETRARDRRQTRTLRARGWTVIRVWEHEVEDLPTVVRRIRAAIASAAG